MTTIEHNGQQFEAYSSIHEMTVGDFVDLLSLIRSGADTSTLDYQLSMMAIISRIPRESLETMDLARFAQLGEILSFDPFEIPEFVSPEEIGQGTDKAESSFELDGEVYHWQPNYPFSQVGIASKVEDILRGRDLLEMLHWVLAICAYRKGETFDHEALESKARKMAEVPVSVVMKQLFFSSDRDRNAMTYIAAFSKKERAKAVA